MDIRSLARNAARSEHLRNVRRRSRPAKGKRSWSSAEQENVKRFFPNKRSLEKGSAASDMDSNSIPSGAFGPSQKAA